MTALLLLASALAVVLALHTSGWFLLVLPFSVPAAFGAWLGLGNEELFDVVTGGDGDGDAGRGLSGWWP